ncbi:MAG: protein YgfX [bacterium]
MSSSPYDTVLILEPDPSHWLAAWIWGWHGLALAVVIFFPLSWSFYGEIRVLCLLAILLSAYYEIQHYLQQVHRSSVLRAVWDEDGEWQLLLADYRVQSVQLSPKSLLTPWLMCLRFHSLETNKRYTLLLFADALSAETLRQFRLRMRLSAKVVQHQQASFDPQ